MRGWASVAAMAKKADREAKGPGVDTPKPKAGSLKDASSPLGFGSLRNIALLLDRGATASGEADEEEARKAKVAEVEEKWLLKLRRDAELEDARLEDERKEQEKDERRLNVQNGVRTHPQLRQLDVLVLELQANETAKRTKYLEWRSDILELEDIHVVDPIRFDEHVEEIQEKMQRLALSEQELAIGAQEVEQQKRIEEAVFEQLQQEAMAKNAAAEQEYEERQKLKLLSQRGAASAREWAMKEARKTQEEQRRRRLNAVIQRWNGQSLAFVFFPWAEHSAQVSKIKAFAGTTLKRWLSGSMARAFDLWTHRMSEKREIKEIARSVVGRWMQQNLSLAFQSWNDYVSNEHEPSEVLCSLAWRFGAAHRRSHRRVVAAEWAAEQEQMAPEEDVAGAAVKIQAMARGGADRKKVKARRAEIKRAGAEQVVNAAEQRLLASAEEVAERWSEQAVIENEAGKQTLSAKMRPIGHVQTENLEEHILTSSTVATTLFWVDGESPGRQLHERKNPAGQIHQAQQEIREEHDYNVRQHAIQKSISDHATLPDKHVPMIEELRDSVIEPRYPEPDSNEREARDAKHLSTFSTTILNTTSTAIATSKQDDSTKALEGKVSATNPGMKRDKSAKATRSTSSRDQREHETEKAQERQPLKSAIVQEQPFMQTPDILIPTRISTTSRAVPHQLSKGQRALPPSYTGPTSPEVDRKRLHDWTRAGDGDPRSESFYFANGSLSHASPLGRGQVTSEVGAGKRDVGIIDAPLFADGLQSDGLESNRHVFRGQVDSDQGHSAIRSIYRDLDEANRILERFCNKHLLPRSVATNGRQHQKATEFFLGHAQQTQEPLILGVSGSVDFAERNDGKTGQDAPSSPRGGQLSSRAHEVAAQFRRYLRSQAGGCVGWFLQIADADGCVSAQDMVDDLRRSCNLSAHDVLELAGSLCDPYHPHLIRLSRLWAVLQLEDSSAIGVGGGDSPSTRAEVNVDDLDRVWEAIEEGHWNAHDEGLYLRRNPGMTREEFDWEIIRMSKSAADKLDSILESQEELELCIRLEAQLLQRGDEGTIQVFGDRIDKVRESQSPRNPRPVRIAQSRAGPPSRNDKYDEAAL